MKPSQSQNDNFPPEEGMARADAIMAGLAAQKDAPASSAPAASTSAFSPTPTMPADWAKIGTANQLAFPGRSSKPAGIGNNDADDALAKIRKAFGGGDDTPGKSYKSPQMQNDA